MVHHRQDSHDSRPVEQQAPTDMTADVRKAGSFRSEPSERARAADAQAPAGRPPDVPTVGSFRADSVGPGPDTPRSVNSALNVPLPEHAKDESETLCENLVVPEDHDAVLLAPSLRRLPPGKATAPFEITDAMGTMVLGVWLARDPYSGISDHAVEQVELKTRDDRTIAFCNIMVPQTPDQAGGTQCKVHRWSGDMFGSLEPATHTGSSPAFVFSSNGGGRLFFNPDEAKGGFVVTDQNSQRVVTTERQGGARSQDVSKMRLAPKADTALVLCCLLAIDRMTPEA